MTEPEQPLDIPPAEPASSAVRADIAPGIADLVPAVEPSSGTDGASGADELSEADPAAASSSSAARRRRRGSRGGRGRRRPTSAEGVVAGDGDLTDDGGWGDDGADADEPAATGRTPADPSALAASQGSVPPDELPDRPIEGRIQDPVAAERALVRKPQIGDSRPAPAAATTPPPTSKRASGRPERGGRGGSSRPPAAASGSSPDADSQGADPSGNGKKRRRKTSRASGTQAKGHAAGPVALDAEVLERRRGRERNGRPVGRYLMCVHVRPELVQIAVLQGRNLIEHYVSRPSDDVAQIHGNIYLGRVQNVLPGMEAAFVDIGTPKNAVLYRGDVQYDQEDLLEPTQAQSSRPDKGRSAERPRIEEMLKNKQLIVSQVTKNPIGAKGARLTQEVSLPGRFVVLIPNSRTYGISKRLADDERRRLRSILDRVKPEEHGMIVRTAAESVSEDELRADVLRLVAQWDTISAKAKQARGPALLYREPGLAVRVIREELNADYRGVVIDDPDLYAEVRDYVGALNPELADRIERFDPEVEGLPLFEQHHVHEQLHKALDRKVWLPSGGYLIIDRTEAMTVIDVNTGKFTG
ncbi:MAG TPA: ribonuclease E/G, partial [Acidimicrobiales bacterium]